MVRNEAPFIHTCMWGQGNEKQEIHQDSKNRTEKENLLTMVAMEEEWPVIIVYFTGNCF